MASKRISSLSEGDPKNVQEFMDKIAGNGRKKEKSASQIKQVEQEERNSASRFSTQQKKTFMKKEIKTQAKEEEEEEEELSESSESTEEVIDLNKPSSQKPKMKMAQRSKQDYQKPNSVRSERSREEKLVSNSKENKQIKILETSIKNKKSNIVVNNNNNIKNNINSNTNGEGNSNTDNKSNGNNKNKDNKNNISSSNNVISPMSNIEKPQIKEDSISIRSESKYAVKKSALVNNSQIKVSSSEEEDSISENSDEKKSKISREKKILKKPIKQQLTSELDTSKITDEISRIIQRIEEKRKKTGSVSDRKKAAIEKMMTSAFTRDKSSTAELYNFKVQFNNNIKVEHIINISDLIKKENILKTEVLLALIEIACNASYYSLSAFNRAKSFWVDVLKYPDLKRIFEPLKAETLKKYWININRAGDPCQVADFIKKHQKLFLHYKIAVLPMISTTIQYFSKSIDNVESFIKNLPKEPARFETELIEILDDETGKIRTEKIKSLTTFKRARYGKSITRKFYGKNNINDPDEIIEG